MTPRSEKTSSYLRWGVPRKRVLPALLALLAAVAGAARGEQAPAAAPAPPRIKDPRTEALIAWVDGVFNWGPGETTVDEVQTIRVPGWRLWRAEKKFKADDRLNDATFLAVDDRGQTAIVGDAFLDQARLKQHQPLKGDADLAGLRDQLARFFRGKFHLVLDPAHDRPGWKGVAVKLDSGYGDYEVGGYVTAADGAFLLLGRAWDRRRSIPEQRKEALGLKDAPSDGPANARVTVVEFSDMECGFCKRRTADWEPLAAKLAPQLSIRRVFKFFPLTSEHPWAFRASSAALCLFQLKGNDVFLNFKKQVYAQQEQMTVPAMDLFSLDYARANDVPEMLFTSCYLQERSVKRILSDLTEGFALRVRATPTYFIDGISVSWYGDDIMEEFLRTKYLKGAGLPLPTRPPAAKPAGGGAK